MPNLVVPGDSVGSDQWSKPHLAVPGDRGFGDGPPRQLPIDPFRDGPLPSDGGNPAPPGYVNQTAADRTQGAVTGPDAIPMVYGKQMVEGRVINVGYDYYNRWRDIVIGVAAGEVYSVTLADTPAGVFQSDPAWHVYLGPLAQTPYPAFAYVTARQYLMYWDGTTWLPYNPPVEMPSAWRFIVEGRLVTDTRTGVTAYSTNPAMCLRHFILSATYGGGMSSSDLDEQSFKDAADICDQIVDGKKRYELNIAILSEASVEQWIETICTHFAAKLYLQDGKYRLWVDGVTSDSGILFDASNSREWKLTETPVSERPSRVVIEYPREDNLWALDKATTELPGASTSGQTREASYKMEGITDAQRAQRLAEYLLKVQATAPLRVTFTASPLAARISRGSRFKLTFPNGVTAQDFLITDMQPQENGEFAMEAREYDAAVYSPGAAVVSPPVPDPGPDPAATPPDVTVVAWGLHTVRTPGTSPNINETSYVRLKFTLPADYVFGSCLVVRGKLDGASFSSEPAWDDLVNEIVVPLTGNLPPEGGYLYLYWPTAHKSEEWDYFPSGVLKAHIENTDAYKVMVRMRSIAGNLSTGVKTYSAHALNSISNYSDEGSANQNTKELRLMEDPANGTNRWSLKAATALSANRTLTLPDSALAAGPIDVDGSGNVSFPGTGVRSTEELRLLEAPANGSNYWSIKPVASLGSNRSLTLPDAAPVAGRLAVDASGNITFFAEYSFSANKNGTDQTGITDSTNTKVTFTTEAFDINSGYDAANSKFVAPVAGKYFFTALLTMSPATGSTDTLLKAMLFVNGSEVRTMANQGNLDTRGQGASVSALLDLAVNDYVEVYTYHTRGSSGTIFGGTTLASFSGFRVA